MPTNMSRARVEIHRMKSVLDSTYQRYEQSITHVPIDVQQDLHLYICVRLSGYLEQLFHQAICAYIADSASDSAASFALSWFRQAPNLNPNALQKLVARLGEKWEMDLEEFLSLGNNRDLLGTLLKIRNDTAHGKSYGGALSNIRSYKKLVDSMHRWVHDRMIGV
jgi:hypothetical protein